MFDDKEERASMGSMCLDNNYNYFKDPLEVIDKSIKDTYENIKKSLNSNSEITIKGVKHSFKQVYTDKDKKVQDEEKIRVTHALMAEYIKNLLNSITKSEICVLKHDEDCSCTFYGDRNQVIRILLDQGHTESYRKVAFLMPKNREDTCFPFNHLSDEEKDRCLTEEFNIPKDRNVMVPPCTLCHEIYKV